MQTPGEAPTEIHTDDPPRWVVVLFGSASEGRCSLNRCPMSASTFPTRQAAEAYADTMPDWTEPHILPGSETAR